MLIAIPPKRMMVRWIVQYAPRLPTAYPGRASTQRGQRTSSVRKARSSSTTRRTKATWPTSTPTLNSSSASGISAFGSPIALRPLAKPKPCSRPNANATTHGWRIVKLVSPRQTRTISGPRKRIDSAIAAFSGGSGALA